MNNFLYHNFIITTLLEDIQRLDHACGRQAAYRLPLPESHHHHHGGSLSEGGPVLDHAFGRYTGQLFLCRAEAEVATFA